MRLNLGAGDRYATGGWINVDRVECPHRKDTAVDLLGPLPWPPGSVSHVYAGHVLEHLPLDACADLLARLLPLMTPAGQIMVVGADLARAQQMAEAGTLAGITMDQLRHGAGRWHGDHHYWEQSPELIAGLLADAGWADIVHLGIGEVPAEWPVAERAPVWQCAISAVRGTT